MPNFNQKKIILGIDPGLADTGFGIISDDKNKLSILTCGTIKTSAKLEFAERLKKISRELKKIINKFQPDLVAIEELFFCKNIKTALSVGQARGAILLTCQNYNLPINEFTPLQVKQAVVGFGRAEKKQIQFMVKTLLHLKEAPKSDDAADALAVAVCCAHSAKF